jgi:hypothetical protein
MELRIPCSPEQEDVIADHAMFNAPLGILPDEKAWMLSRARALHPGCKILAADLDIENASWVLTIE